MKKKELNQIIKQTTEEAINNIAPEVREQHHVESSLREGQESRYSYYQTSIQAIKKYEIRGEADTFIEAACMCEALIRFKCVTFDIIVGMPNELALINYNIALNVALAMIQKCSVYEEQGKRWVEIPKQISPKPVVPIGIIPDASLRERIIRGLVCRDMAVKDFSTFEFSNTLHLIYLCNQ